jgi:hypothetical protein
VGGQIQRRLDELIAATFPGKAIIYNGRLINSGADDEAYPEAVVLS